MMCDNFWADFFSTCQSPVEGLRLFPVNQSRMMIYCNFFYYWWSITYGGHAFPDDIHVPVGVDKELYKEMMEEEKEEPHAELDCNSPGYLASLLASVRG